MENKFRSKYWWTQNIIKIGEWTYQTAASEINVLFVKNTNTIFWLAVVSEMVVEITTKFNLENR